MPNGKCVSNNKTILGQMPSAPPALAAPHLQANQKLDEPSYLMCETHALYDGREFSEKFLVDTGACAVYLRLDLARKLYGEEFPSDDVEVMTCVVANAHEEETFRAPLTRITVQGRSILTRPFVMKTLSYKGILGYSALKSMGFMVDPPNDQLLISGKSVSAVSSADLELPCPPVESGELGVVAAAKACTIPPKAACLVPALLRGDSQVNEFCLIEQIREGALSDGLIVASSLATMENSHVHVLVTNTTESELSIHRFSRLANAIRVEHSPRPTLSAVSSTSSPPRMSKQDFLSQFSFPDNLSSREAERLREFLWKERQVFSFSDSDIGCFKGIKHTIDTGNERPYRETLRRHSPKTREDIRVLVKEMLDQGIIRPSFSPWSSAPVLVQKKSGGKRFAVDYRGLNSRTIQDSYPLPHIADALDCFAGARHFSTLDLTSGFWQIELDEQSIPKTAFITPQGLYEFVRMPFGLCSAPSTFSRAMACCLEGLNWEIALCFLDDIIVFSRSFDEHISRLSQVFERLNSFNLKLKPRKCEFFQPEVAYLGHRISADGISTDPGKVEAIKNWRQPTTATQVRSFLGLAQYYRRFVKDFSSVASPLYDCIHHGVQKISWGSAQEAAFQEIKNRLSSPPIMAHPNFELPFIVDSDASQVGIGCVLSQEIDGKERVIAYASHKFNKAERKWHTTDREFFALVMACRLFKSYLYGRRFTMRTDHQALIGLQRKSKEFTGKLARWWTELSLYTYSLVYRRGVSHGNADGLSRQPHFEEDDEVIADDPGEVNALQATPADPVDIISLQRGDPTISFIVQHICKYPGKPLNSRVNKDDDEYLRHFKRHWRQYSVKDQILRMGKLVVMPRAGIPGLLFVLHDSPLSGHMGKTKTLKSVNGRFWWPGLATDVYAYVRSCWECQARKPDVNKTYAPLCPSEPTSAPWDRLAMDIVSLPPSNGYDKVLVIVDYFSKWVEAFPIRNKNASTIASILYQEIYSRYGPPSYLHSDRGTEFISQVVHQLSQISSVYQTHTAAYSPRADGQVERQIRTLADMLAKYYNDKGNWYDYLHPCLMAIRSSVHETTGFSPFQVMFGRTPRLMVDLNYGLPATSSQKHPNTYRELQSRLRDVYSDVKRNQSRVAERMKQAYDSKRKVGVGRFTAGQWVWVHVPPVHRGKLLPKWEGPFLVDRVNEYGSVYVCRSGGVVKTRQDRCKLFAERPTHLQSKEYRDSFAKARLDYSQNPPELRLERMLQGFSGGSQRLPCPPDSSLLGAYSPPSGGISIPASVPVVPGVSAPQQQSVVSPAPLERPAEAPSSRVSAQPQLQKEPVVRLERLPEAVVSHYLKQSRDKQGDSQPNAQDSSAMQSGGEDSPLPIHSPPVEEMVQPSSPPMEEETAQPSLPPTEGIDQPSSPPLEDITLPPSPPPVQTRPPRNVQAPKRLTYDEDFKQVSSLYKRRSVRRLFSCHPFLELGLVVLNSQGGLRVAKLFPGLMADVQEICQPGDLLTKVNNIPVTDTLSFINMLPTLGPVFTLEFVHRR